MLRRKGVAVVRKDLVVTRRGTHGEAIAWTWLNVGTITMEKIKGKERYVARTASEEFRALSFDSAVDRMALAGTDSGILRQL